MSIFCPVESRWYVKCVRACVRVCVYGMIFKYALRWHIHTYQLIYASVYTQTHPFSVERPPLDSRSELKREQTVSRFFNSWFLPNNLWSPNFFPLTYMPEAALSLTVSRYPVEIKINERGGPWSLSSCTLAGCCTVLSAIWVRHGKQNVWKHGRILGERPLNGSKQMLQVPRLLHIVRLPPPLAILHHIVLRQISTDVAIGSFILWLPLRLLLLSFYKK